MSLEAPWQLDWKAIDGNRFQDLCLDLLSCEGYELQDQGIGPDGGVDAILAQKLALPDGTARQIRWVAQFKFKVNPEGTVKPRELGNVENILGRFQAEGFFLVTNGRVTNKALLELRGTLAQRHPSYFLSVWNRRHVEQQLAAHREIASRYFSLPPTITRATAKFEITVDLSLEDFSDLQQRLLRHALASFLEVSVDAISIREISRGSTKVLIEVPEKAAQLLREALEGKYLSLAPFGFEPVIVSVREIDPSMPIGGATSARVSTFSKPTAAPARFPARRRARAEESAWPTQNPEPEREHRFKQLFERYYRSVYAYLVNSGFSPERARELAQETFLRVYTTMDKFRGVGEWNALQTVARRLVHNEFRMRKAMKRSEVQVSSDEPSNLPDSLNSSPRSQRPESPEEGLVEREEAARRRKLLRDAIADLPEGVRVPLLLRLSGLTYKEIQGRLNISMDTVKSRLHEARIFLRARLAKEIDWPETSEEDDHD